MDKVWLAGVSDHAAHLRSKGLDKEEVELVMGPAPRRGTDEWDRRERARQRAGNEMICMGVIPPEQAYGERDAARSCMSAAAVRKKVAEGDADETLVPREVADCACGRALRVKRKFSHVTGQVETFIMCRKRHVIAPQAQSIVEKWLRGENST